MPKSLYKTTLVVWSNFDPKEVSANNLVKDSSNSYISYRNTRILHDPEQDPHWDHNNHFEENSNED